MKYSGVKWIGDIPETWNITKVKECFYISKEKAHQEDPVVLSLARAGIKVRDISTNEGQLAASYEDYNPVIPGDLLLNPMDLYSGANCNVSEVSGVISSAYINLRKKVELNPKYFDYYFKVQYWAMAMFAHGKGVSFDNRWTMNTEAVLNYYLPYPSLDEQNRIVNFLNRKCNEIDKLVEIENNQIQMLKEYKESYIFSLVKNGFYKNHKYKKCKLDYSDKIPETWTIYKLKHLVSLKTGSTPPTDIYEYFDGDVNWFTPGDFKDNEVYESSRKISEIAVRDGYEPFPPFSTLIIGIGGTAGKVAYMTSEGYSNQQITALIPININKKFLYYLVNSLSKIIKDKAQYTTLPIINNTYLGNIKVGIPSQVEQLEIVDKLDSKCNDINLLINLKQKKVAELKEYKKSIIYEYVTGKKEV